MRYLIRVSYDGSKLYGFQRQTRKKTVQGELEKVLTKINKTIVYVKGAGRTDRGVHARGQCVHFDLTISIEPVRLKNAMNSMLDGAIYVTSCQYVNDDFHARFDVKKKIYQYVINLGEYDPISDSYFYNYNHSLQLNKMKKASKFMVGIHSYEAFTAGKRDSYNSILYKIKFKKKKDILVIQFEGKSFYRYMVRNLVGALIEVGRGRIKEAAIKEMLDSGENLYNVPTSPPNGLYLQSIEY